MYRFPQFTPTQQDKTLLNSGWRICFLKAFVHISQRFGVYESKTKAKVTEGGKEIVPAASKLKSEGQGLAVLLKC